MSNTVQNSKENIEKLHKKIKETWTGLSGEEVRLYEGKRDDFYAALKNKHSVSREDGEKKMIQIEKDCGCSLGKDA